MLLKVSGSHGFRSGLNQLIAHKPTGTQQLRLACTAHHKGELVLLVFVAVHSKNVSVLHESAMLKMACATPVAIRMCHM